MWDNTVGRGDYVRHKTTQELFEVAKTRHHINRDEILIFVFGTLRWRPAFEYAKLSKEEDGQMRREQYDQRCREKAEKDEQHRRACISG